MREELLRIATFASPIEAHLAKNRLEAAGIQAFLSGEETASMAWHIGAAEGGIKLLVGADDAPRANACLMDPAAPPEPAANELPPGVSPTDITVAPKPLAPVGIALEPADGSPEEGEDEEADAELPPTEREKNAHRAALGAVLGLFVLPLQFYVFYLLLRVYLSEEPLGTGYRGKAWIAAAINLPVLLIMCIILRAWFSD